MRYPRFWGLCHGFKISSVKPSEHPWMQQPTRLLPGIDKIEKILTRRNFDQAVGRVATWLIKLRPWDVSGRPEEDWNRDWRKHLGAVNQYNASNNNQDPIVSIAEKIEEPAIPSMMTSFRGIGVCAGIVAGFNLLNA